MNKIAETLKKLLELTKADELNIKNWKKQSICTRVDICSFRTANRPHK